MLPKAEDVIEVIAKGDLQNLPTVLQDVEKLVNNAIAGGASSAQAQDSFYLIFLSLLDRLLGEDSTGCVPSTSWTHGRLGGWIRESIDTSDFLLTKYQRLPDYIYKHPSLNAFSRLLVHHLHPNGNLFKLMTRMHRCYETYLEILPQKVQLRLLQRPEYECLQCNHHFLYDAYAAHDPTGSVSVTLDVIVYFLICFVRYPLTENVFPSSRAVEGELPIIAALERGGHAEWSIGNPYLQLLSQYLHTYFPPHSPLTVDSTLFLRLMIDFWMDAHLIVRYDFARVGMYRETLRMDATQLQRANELHAAARHSPMNQSHPPCTDLVTLESMAKVSSVCSRGTMQCIFMLVSHVMHEFDLDTLQSLSSMTLNMHNRKSITSLPLLPAMTMLQQPVFDLLRMIFATELVDLTVFVLGVKLWHMWLTPYRRVVVKGSAVYDLSKQFSSDWQAYVASNLASNKYYFQALEATLQIFTPHLCHTIDSICTSYLTYLRDLGFRVNVSYTPHNGTASHISPEMKQRVEDSDNLPLRAVNQGELLAVKYQHEHLYPDRTMTADQAVQDFRRETCTDVYDGVRRLGERKRKNDDFMDTLLKVFFTVKEEKSMPQLRVGDVLSLLEITFRISPHPRHRGDSITPTMAPHRDIAVRSLQLGGPQRDHLGRLTEKGRLQVISGKMTCTTDQIKWRGDVLLQPIKSFEIRFLVKILVHISKVINRTYALPADQSSLVLTWPEIWERAGDGIWNKVNTIKYAFRVNLRFLAHTRVFALSMALFFWVLHVVGLLGSKVLYAIVLGLAALFYHGSLNI